MNTAKQTSKGFIRLYSPALAVLLVLIPFFSYYLNEVKQQQGYQNDRAFRLLDLISRQFAAEIEGAHRTMDSAFLLPMQSQDLLPNSGEPKRDPKLILNYLDAYIPDKYVPGDKPIPLAHHPETPELKQLKGAAGLEPAHSHAVVQFQDSRSYIELSHAGSIGKQKYALTIFLDPSKMLSRAAENDHAGFFDTVFVGYLQNSGEVLAQSTNPQVNVLLLENLLKSLQIHGAIESKTTSKEPDDPKSDPLAIAASGANQRFEVQLSGATYVLFLVPAPFRLDDDRQGESKSKASIPMAFYGLVRKELLDKRAIELPDLAIPTTVLILLAVFAFLWPALKLQTMSDRERLRESLVAATFATTLFGGVLVATLALCWGLFRSSIEEADQNLKSLAGMMDNHLEAELHDGFEMSNCVLQLVFGKHHGKRLSFDALEGTEAGQREHTAAEEINFHYPYFRHLIVTAPDSSDRRDDQTEIFKISSNAIPTPLIPFPASRYSFLTRLQVEPSKLDDREFVLESSLSPNTGEFLPRIVFRPAANNDPSISPAMRIMLATELPSLVNVIFPRGYGFAVIDAAGNVQFHSDKSRNLKENFFNECEDASQLRRLTHLGQQSEHLDLRYGGQAIRAYYQPLDQQIKNLGLGVVVYVHYSQIEWRVHHVGLPFLSELIAVALLFTLLPFLFRHWMPSCASTISFLKRRAWPREHYRASYMVECVLGLACLVPVVALALAAQRPPAWLFPAFVLFPISFIPSKRKNAAIISFFQKLRLRRWACCLPIDYAYPASIFVLGLWLLGGPSLLLFHHCVNQARALERTDDSAYFRERMQARNETTISALHARTPNAEQSELCKEWRRPFDIYNLIYPDIADAPKMTACVGSANSTLTGNTPWNILPPLLVYQPPSSGHPGISLHTNNIKFIYVPLLFVLIAVYIWLREIVRCLFLLDFDEPEMDPPIVEAQLKTTIQSALANTNLIRKLIFAHPHSGTSLALADILRACSCHLLVDFAGLTAADIENIADLTQGLATAVRDKKLVIFDNFESRLTEVDSRNAKLAALEVIVYRQSCSVLVFTSSDPLLYAKSLLDMDPENEALQVEVNRWTRVMSNFERNRYQSKPNRRDLEPIWRMWKSKVQRANPALSKAKERAMRDMLQHELNAPIFQGAHADRIDLSGVDLASPRQFEKSLVRLVRQFANNYYSGIWLNCTSDERLALYQIAKDNWFNPRNKVAISHLWLKQLLEKDKEGNKRDGAFRLKSLSFRGFILDAVTKRELALWQSQQSLSSWPSIRMAIGATVVVLVGFMFYVDPDLFETYFGNLIALAGGGAALTRIIVQFFTKPNWSLGRLTKTAVEGTARAREA